MMRISRIVALYQKEIVDALRDRATVFTVFVLPLVLYPLLFVVSGVLTTRMRMQEEHLVPTVAVASSVVNGPLGAALWEGWKIRTVASTDPAGDVRAGRTLAGLAAPELVDDLARVEHDVAVTVFYDDANGMSVKARDKVVHALEEFARTVTIQRLVRRSIEPRLISVFAIHRQSVTSEERLGGFLLGILVPYLLVVVLFAASMNAANDITAGEKERKTLETLLASDISRAEIALGKLSAVITAGLVSSILGLIGLVAVFAAGLFVVGPLLPVKPTIGALPLTFSVLMLVPLAVLVGSVLIALGSWARSAKEASTYAGYLLMVVAMLGLVSVVRRGARPPASSFFVPIVNTTLVQQELLVGIVDWNHIGWTLLSTLALAAVALKVAVAAFSSERALFRT